MMKKRDLCFILDRNVVDNYMLEHGIKTYKEFFDYAGIEPMIGYRLISRSHPFAIGLLLSWQLSDYMGVMIENIVIALPREEAKERGVRGYRE